MSTDLLKEVIGLAEPLLCQVEEGLTEQEQAAGVPGTRQLTLLNTWHQPKLSISQNRILIGIKSEFLV